MIAIPLSWRANGSACCSKCMIPTGRCAVRIVTGALLDAARVAVSPRIGITRAADWPLRFFEAGNPFVSTAPKHFAVTSYTP
jgi:hypothetical protein